MSMALMTLVTVGLSAAPLVEEPGEGAGATAIVTVEVAGLASERGSVECVLWGGPLGFPADTQRARTKVRTQHLAQSAATCIFEGVPPGTFAVSISHDENENGRVDTNFLGIPTERYGFSRNPRPLMRAPRFEESSFEVAGAPVVLRVVVR